MSELFVCNDLCKSFGKRAALNHINLTIESGKIVGLLGPNGAGKTTLIKIANGLLQPSSGELLICDKKPSVETKKIVSFLPDRMYYSEWMKVADMLDLFADFYEDFDRKRAEEMCNMLGLDKNQRIKTLSKGTIERLQLILVMSRSAKLYLLDEPIGGVDPATRDFIIRTIITNYCPDSSVIISTHLVSDVEQILDEVVFIKDGEMILHDSVDNIRQEQGISIDKLFREKFRADGMKGGNGQC